MPVILPTAEEIDRMGWREREIARDRAIRLLNAIAMLPSSPSRAATETTADWAQSVRTQAQRLQASTPPDPQASQHRLALLEAVRGLA